MTSGPSTVPLPYSRDEAAGLLGPEWRTRAEAMLGWMLLARTLDARMQALQRQGRVGFYGAATGQEAVSVAAGLASAPEDWVLPGLREQLVALVRGHPLGTYVHHLFADARDPALGRNMPCHPTAGDVHYVSMSSVIGTQITHAVGVGYAMRRRRASAAALAFFGDGATSANDFHAGLNFAAVWKAPVVFCCTNNQWAISMPVERQTASESIATKGPAYGMPAKRLDGTDSFAVYHEVGAALDAARRGVGPTLLELVVYRMTPHSSSDDPARYQPKDWGDRAKAHDPVERLAEWMTREGILTPELRESWTADADARVREAIRAAESTEAPAPETLTEGVFATHRDPTSAGGGPA
jgi:pyruvate dehydrogenase E1 component alpha subunit